MHPAEIKAALALAGYKQNALAGELEIAPTTVGAVINGRSRSATLEQRIAQINDLMRDWYRQGWLFFDDGVLQLTSTGHEHFFAAAS